MIIDSTSTGDSTAFRSFDALVTRLQALPAAPRDGGRVVALVSRDQDGRRILLDRAQLTVEGGMPGDRWGRQRRPNADAQLTVMQRDVAELIANGQPLQLFGDNLVLELDLSSANLPMGSRLRAGGVTLEVTPMPHNGCRKFGARFGADALQLVNDPGLRHRNLRGIYMCVVESGDVGVGDPVLVVSRPIVTSA